MYTPMGKPAAPAGTPDEVPVRGIADGPMNVYRVTRWVSLAGELDQLKYRKAVVAMSVGPVDRRWLTAEAGLRRKEVDALLLLLQQEGALDVLPAPLSPTIDSFDPPPGVRAGFMPRLRHWLQGGGIASPR